MQPTNSKALPTSTALCISLAGHNTPKEMGLQRGSGTVRNLLVKSNNPYVALMSYHSMALENTYSSSQLLMQKKLRPTVPIVTEQLLPIVPPNFIVKEKEVVNRE